MEKGDEWFDLKQNSDDIIFRMNFDETMSELVFTLAIFLLTAYQSLTRLTNT